MNISILVFDGADELDFVGPYEIFRSAAALSRTLTSSLVTVAPRLEVVAAHGLRLRPEGVLQGRPHLLVVPGGGWVGRAPRGIRAEIEQGELTKAVAALQGGGTIIAGVCTGVMALAHAGLLKGRAATTHHGAYDDLRAMGARVLKKRVVDDGDIVTCGGVTSSLDLALWLVERFCGAGMAEDVARSIEYTRSGEIHVSERDGQGAALSERSP